MQNVRPLPPPPPPPPPPLSFSPPLIINTSRTLLVFHFSFSFSQILNRTQKKNIYPAIPDPTSDLSPLPLFQSNRYHVLSNFCTCPFGQCCNCNIRWHTSHPWPVPVRLKIITAKSFCVHTNANIFFCSFFLKPFS